MESYGEILRNKREEKNLNIDKIAREISIEGRYLQGLEDELLPVSRRQLAKVRAALGEHESGA